MPRWSRLLACAALAALSMLVAPAAAAGDDTTTDDTTPADTVPDELGNSLPRPNAGPDPVDAGDRGGWLQLVLLGVIVTGAGFVVMKLIRSSSAVGNGSSRP